jgi:hypothetical protein
MDKNIPSKLIKSWHVIVNTEENCFINICAFSLLWLTSFPFSFRGATMILSGFYIFPEWFAVIILHSLCGMDKNIPSKQIRSNNKLPWFNKKIKRMLKKKQSLYNQAKGTKKWSNYRFFQKECSVFIFIDDIVEFSFM